MLFKKVHILLWPIQSPWEETLAVTFDHHYISTIWFDDDDFEIHSLCLPRYMYLQSKLSIVIEDPYASFTHRQAIEKHWRKKWVENFEGDQGWGVRRGQTAVEVTTEEGSHYVDNVVMC